MKPEDALNLKPGETVVAEIEMPAVLFSPKRKVKRVGVFVGYADNGNDVLVNIRHDPVNLGKTALHIVPAKRVSICVVKTEGETLVHTMGKGGSKDEP